MSVHSIKTDSYYSFNTISSDDDSIGTASFKDDDYNDVMLEKQKAKKMAFLRRKRNDELVANQSAAHFTPKSTTSKLLVNTSPLNRRVIDEKLRQEQRRVQMPNPGVFEMDDDESLQKRAFVEVWVDSLQKNAPVQGSLVCRFSNALESYFKDRQANSEEHEKKRKGEINGQLFVNSPNIVGVQTPNSKIVSTPSTDSSPLKPYVSPFEDMPPVSAASPSINLAALEKNKKAPIIVPAGFDLTSLVQYKDPNHWHRCSTTRRNSNDFE